MDSEFPEEEKAAGLQRILENRQYSLLQRRAHVDQHVPATDEIQLGKRRIAGQIVPREDAQIAHELLDLIAMVGLDEKRLQPRRRHPGDSRLGVDAGAGISTARSWMSVPKI